MASPDMEYPAIDWDAADLLGEFTRFRDHVQSVFAGPLSELIPKEKATWLGIWIGAHGRDIYKTFTWEENEEDDPDRVLGHFEEFVSKTSNKQVAGQRAKSEEYDSESWLSDDKRYDRRKKSKRACRQRLMRRKQWRYEPFHHFVTCLSKVIMDCGYVDAEDMLTDVIIAGIYEPQLKKILIDQGDELTLTEVHEIGQQFELACKEGLIMRDEDDHQPGVSAIAGQRNSFGKSRAKPYGSQFRRWYKWKPCLFCGKDRQHLGNDGVCPAFGTTCSYCNGRNHWAVKCGLRRGKQKRQNEFPTEDNSVPCAADDE
uniref:ubiquinone biosynthesis O-methyltransferase, mitochondrial isoform X1 n=1 Tax=Myxine glutinosa TaxID=7769 RepID=UPI00358DDFDB